MMQMDDLPATSYDDYPDADYTADEQQYGYRDEHGSADQYVDEEGSADQYFDEEGSADQYVDEEGSADQYVDEEGSADQYEYPLDSNHMYGPSDGQADSDPPSIIGDDNYRPSPRETEEEEEQDFVGHLYHRRRTHELKHLPPVVKATYLTPTLSSSLPYYGNELERIRNSYRSGSWYSIKTLPSKLGNGMIRLARKERITDNLVSNRVKDAFKPASKRSDTFHRSEYIGRYHCRCFTSDASLS
jgi:hypothetical protein